MSFPVKVDTKLCKGLMLSRVFICDQLTRIIFTRHTPNNKRVISTFMFDYPCLTLKEGPKVKSDHIKRFFAHHFHRLVSHFKPLRSIISEL